MYSRKKLQSFEERKAQEALMAPHEFGVLRCLLNNARSDKYRTVKELVEAARNEFPACDDLFIRRCLARLGRGLCDDEQCDS